MLKIFRQSCFLFFISSPSYAEIKLDCHVERAPEVDKISRENISDKAKINSTKILEQALISQKFVVDLKSGKISGDIQNYTQSKNPDVIQYGIKNGHYKSLLNAPYIDGEGAAIVYFVANINGIGNRKPFNLINDFGIYMGSCELKNE